jgi:hypothetical protein
MARTVPSVAAARVPVPAAFWRRHKDEAAALNRLDGFAGQARDGSVQLWLGHGTSFRENRKRARGDFALFWSDVLCGGVWVKRAIPRR